jgi:hypothetical protein
MSYEEAQAWLQGKRSTTNWAGDKWAELDVLLTQQAYWIVKAHKENLVDKESE